MTVNHLNPTQNKVPAKIPANQGYKISIIQYELFVFHSQSCAYVSYPTEQIPSLEMQATEDYSQQTMLAALQHR